MEKKPVPSCRQTFPSAEAREFPTIVNMAVCHGMCPCRCVHCPVGTISPDKRTERFGQKFAELALYDKVSREIGAHPSAALRVHGVGEPLLWPLLPDALAVGKSNGARTWIFTSAVTRDAVLLDAVCENVDIVEVSVNSTGPADYRATKGIDAFTLVTENIRHIRRRIDAGVSVRLVVSRVQSDVPAADDQFREYWMGTGLVDDAFVRSYHTYNDILPNLPEDGPAATHQPCLVHWARFNVTVDGLAIVCFNELFKRRLDPGVVLGDVNTRSIAEIWRGPKLEAIRKAELAGDYSALEAPEALPCRNCTFCQSLGGSGPTSESQLTHLDTAENGA